MSLSRENISLWINQSEPDYFLFFLKAWIPFNAWYVAEYPLLKKNDRDIIKELQDNIDSKPKQIIENFLLNSSEFDSIVFLNHLSELHYYLERIPLNHNNKRLSFKNLSLADNPIKFKNSLDEEFNVYKVEKTSSYFQAYIEAKSGKVLLDYKPPKFDLEGLTKDTDFIRLKPKIQNKIYSLFEDIDPKKPISIISVSSRKGDYIHVKSKHPCKLITNKEVISKACIKVIYTLRCMLFHGEVSPTNANKPIYEHAYYLIRLIISELH